VNPILVCRRLTPGCVCVAWRGVRCVGGRRGGGCMRTLRHARSRSSSSSSIHFKHPLYSPQPVVTMKHTPPARSTPPPPRRNLNKQMFHKDGPTMFSPLQFDDEGNTIIMRLRKAKELRICRMAGVDWSWGGRGGGLPILISF